MDPVIVGKKKNLDEKKREKFSQTANTAKSATINTIIKLTESNSDPHFNENATVSGQFSGIILFFLIPN